MDNLTSIDLTQGMRFEKAMKMDQSIINNILDFRDSYLHRRLSGGEIPHNTGHTLNSGITITTSSDLSDWIVNTTVDIDSTTIRWNTSGWDNSWRTTTSFTNTFNTIDEFDIDTTNITNNIWVRSIGDEYTWFASSSRVKSIADYDISKRLEYDPFTLYEDNSNFDTIEHLSRADYASTRNQSGVLKRLTQDGMNDGEYYSGILDVLEYASQDDSDVSDTLFGVFRSYELSDDAKLKQQAPFIKRVYKTNRGFSFDDTELRFDLILAQEHFNEAISNLERI